VVRQFLLPVMVAVSCLTALTTPILVRLSGPIAEMVDARLPRRLQAFVSFYGTWIEGIRAAPRRDTLLRRIKRPFLVLWVDALFLGGTVVAAAALQPRLTALLADKLALEPQVARVGLAVVATVVAGIFVIGVLRCARRLAQTLAAEVLPPSPQGKLDLGTAPRRALVVTLELAIVLVVGLPLVAVIQPWVPAGLVVLGLLVGMLGFAAWRNLANFQGHVRAGSELIVEALARQSHSKAPELSEVKEMLPGIPGLSPVRLSIQSPAVGQTLLEVNLRALTGATVLAVHREGGGAVLPTAKEVLRAGDVLALAGPKEAIEAAERLLGGGLPPAGTSTS
jgi:CPA2 family monovalent cation:H+ antiporter-2